MKLFLIKGIWIPILVIKESLNINDSSYVTKSTANSKKISMTF